MTYLDSNVFIYAALYEDRLGESARELIRSIRTGSEIFHTSALTFDEVCWIVKKEKGREESLEIVKAMLRMRNLRFVNVDISILWRSHDLMEEYGLDPRDSIHLSCALEEDLETMVTEDSDFHDIEKIESIDIVGFLERTKP